MDDEVTKRFSAEELTVGSSPPLSASLCGSNVLQCFMFNYWDQFALFLISFHIGTRLNISTYSLFLLPVQFNVYLKRKLLE